MTLFKCIQTFTYEGITILEGQVFAADYIWNLPTDDGSYYNLWVEIK